jgi:hypothetical protein
MKTHERIEKFKIFTAVNILIVFFWVESPTGLVDRSRRFGDFSVTQPKRT